MRSTPLIDLQIAAITGFWMLDPDYGPVCHTVEELTDWLAESAEREWLW